MFIESRLTRDSLIPYKLERWNLPIWLYMKAHGRKKTILERLLAKSSTKMFRIMQSLEKRTGNIRWGRAFLRERSFLFNSLNTQFHSIYQYIHGYELNVMGAILTFLPDDGVFVDAGANWGHFSFSIASLPTFSGKVIAFEPSKTTFDDLNHILEQMPNLKKTIEARNAGLSSRTAAAYLEMKNMYSGVATVSEHNPDGERIDLVRLDDIDMQRLDVIKIDVEGHELEVLEGASETISKLTPTVIIENWYKTESILRDIRPLSLLHNLGYRLFMASIAKSTDHVAMSEPRLADCDNYGLALIEFEPIQRGFFDRHQNVVAIHNSKMGNIRYRSVTGGSK